MEMLSWGQFLKGKDTLEIWIAHIRCLTTNPGRMALLGVQPRENTGLMSIFLVTDDVDEVRT